MTLLLDSHALLWALHSPGKLAPAARRAIEDGTNAVFFSAASTWEIAIKTGKRLLEVEDGLLEAIHEVGFVELPVRAAHTWEIKALAAIHGDPFDRILVAQTRIERLTLVTRDQFLSGYNISILAA
ncbi:MAG TPA: type II toxin-antitoxin system VapC family toxin [Verrucomicrobiae bacterium]|nr:type II toxin-antitoxin system VapC family toxin [Verrucomicrobiae bacterium]